METEALKQEAILAIQDIQATAIDNCYSRYDIWAQLIGTALAVGGGGLLSVLMPGGVIASATLAALAMGATVKFVGDEADRIEQGDLSTLKRYVDSGYVRERLMPLVEKAAKKPIAQGNQAKSTTTKPENGNPSSELQIKPVSLVPDAHLIVWGRTRSGKTNTVQHLLADSSVHYVSTKAKDQVPTGWTGYRIDPRQAEAQLTWLIGEWERLFYSHLDGEKKGDTWFLFDEVISLMSLIPSDLVKRLRDFITQVLTSGAGTGAYIGLLTQSENAGELKVALDLLKNCTIIACSNKACDRESMIQAFTKYSGLALSSVQKQQVQNLSSYWQLWCNNGPLLSQIAEVQIPTKDLTLCPVDKEPDVKKATTKSLNERILAYLRGKSDGQTIRVIQQNVARKSDNPPLSKDAISDAISYLVSEGFITEKTQGSQLTYTIK